MPVSKIPGAGISGGSVTVNQSAPDNSLVIDSSGNVGIGTSSPSSIVETAKAAANTQIRLTESSDSGNDTALFYARRSRGTSLSSPTAIQSGNNMGGLAIGAYNGTSYAIGSRIIGLSNQTWTSSAQGTNLTFSTTADGATSDTERMRIDSSGNLLVGTTATSGTSNGFYCPALFNFTSGSGANTVISSDGLFRRSTSSLKYKKDVQDATHGLAEVLQLRPVTYKGKAEFDGDKVFGGLIAEEVDAIGLTEFVQYAEDGSPDALSYGHMVSLLTKAIQELKAELDATKAEVQALKGAN